MTWLKLDDKMPDNPKVRALKVDARWCYVVSLCYASRNLTDGFIPKGALVEETRLVAKALELAGLWEPVAGGWMIHDYAAHNRTREEAERLSNTRRQAGSKGLAKRYEATPANGLANSLANELAKPTAKSPASALSVSLSVDRDLNTETGEILEREREQQKPSKLLAPPPKTTPTEEWLAEMREKHGPHLKDFDETVRFHMNGSWYAKARDKCGFLEGKLKAAVERERPARLPASPPDMLGPFAHLANRRTS